MEMCVCVTCWMYHTRINTYFDVWLVKALKIRNFEQ